MTAILGEAERHRRAEIIRDSRAALQQGETFDNPGEPREQTADRWLSWWQHEMVLRNCHDPAELLPDACARLEQIVDDRVAAAVAEECASLRAELQALHVELTERWHAELTAICEVLAKRIGEVIDQVEMVNKRLQTELWNLVKTQFRALRARVDGVLPDTKSALRDASERADELPNPLPPRRVIN